VHLKENNIFLTTITNSNNNNIIMKKIKSGNDPQNFGGLYGSRMYRPITMLNQQSVLCYMTLLYFFRKKYAKYKIIKQLLTLRKFNIISIRSNVEVIVVAG